ncbi:MAG: hypothetical protein IT459_16805, partial [Planctomycetes bacterium]|nr:hypothetical protein [Planctomycetota bacterium]
VVTRLDLADRVALTGRLASLYDLAVANEDRQLFVLALGAEADSEELDQQWRTAGVPGALGFVKEHALYADPARGAKSTFVVGRSGELVWLGDPSKDEKGFVAALDVALDRRPAPRITPPSVDALGPALVDYYAGRFDKARAAAKKLAATKAKTDEQKQLVEAAAEVVQAVDEHERVLASRVKLAGGMTKVGELVELDAILKAGFKAPTANLAEEALTESAGRSLMGISKDDYEVWLDLSRRRPVFFPRRTDDGGKKFADELEQYVRRSSNSLEPTQRARELLERFSHAR